MHRIPIAAYRYIPAVVAAAPLIVEYSNLDGIGYRTTKAEPPTQDNKIPQKNSKEEGDEKPFNVGDLFSQVSHRLGIDLPLSDSGEDATGRGEEPSKGVSGTEDLLTMISSAILSSSKQQQQKNITDIVATLRDRSRQDGAVEDRQSESSIFNLLAMLDKYKEELQRIVETYAEHLDINRLRAPALMYYLEHEEEVSI